MKKYFKIFILLFVILLLLFFFRVNILKAFGNHLIKESNFEYIETGFVLSGGAYDRGNLAIELMQNLKLEKVVCVGENTTPNFKALNIDMLESELTRKHILDQIIDSTKVQLLTKGTSTLEESDAILDYCILNNIERCAIISSKFHTKRIHNVFYKKFRKEGIEIYVQGAPSSSYSENVWWKSENGMIALNNEYVKLMYYFFK